MKNSQKTEETNLVGMIKLYNGAKSYYLMPILKDSTEKEIKARAKIVRAKARKERIERIKK